MKMTDNIPKLTYKDAVEKVMEIANINIDDETAHLKEDKLYTHFIYCLSAGMYDKDEAIKIAKTIIYTKEIKFSRWCS